MLRKWIVTALAVLLLALPAAAQTATPTPAPQLIFTLTVPAQTFYESMATAAANVEQMPDDIRIAPDGTNLLDTANVATLFGYVKWLFSDNSAREIFGNTLAPLWILFFVILTINIVLTTVYFLVWFVVLIVRGIVWIINQILKFIPFF